MRPRLIPVVVALVLWTGVVWQTAQQPETWLWRNLSPAVWLFQGVPVSATYFPTPLKSIQTNYVDLNSATSNTRTITSVDTAATQLSVLGVVNTGTSTNADVYWAGCTLTNATTVTCQRGTSAADSEAAYFQVVEYLRPFVKSVQNVSATLSTNTSATATLSPTVTTTKTIIATGGSYSTSGAANIFARQGPRCELTNSSTVTAYVGAGNAAIAFNIYCSVVEFK